MIDFSSVPIVETGRDDHFSTIYTAKASITITAKVEVVKSAGVPEWIIRDRLMKELWHKTYGDLVKPFWELSSTVLRNCDLIALPEIREKLGAIESLLKMPSFKP